MASNSTTGSTASRKLKRPNGTGSYYESAQKPHVFQASIEDIHGKSHVKFFRYDPKIKSSKSKAELDAQNWLAEQVRARELGQATFAVNPKMKISTFLEAWLQSRRPPVITPNTYRNYEGAIRNWINPHVGETKIENFTLNTVEDLNRKLVDLGFKAGTTNVVHRVLSKAFKDAVRKNQLARNPMIGVERIRQSSTPLPHIPMKDFKKILEKAKKSPYTHARVLVGGVLGLRPGEALGLLWSDIDHENRTLTISRQVQAVKGQGLMFQEVKQKGVRSILLPDVIYEALQLLAAQQDIEDKPAGKTEGLIFPNTVGKKLDSKRDVKWWKDLLKTAGVPHYTIYQLRKTAFTNLATGKVDISTLMAISGHSQSSTLLNSYVFATSESMQSALKLMDSIAQGGG